MRKLILLLMLSLLWGCVSTNKPLRKQTTVSVDPFVQKWLTKPASVSSEKMAILVQSKAPLKEYGFLKHSEGNYYTGHVTREQLKVLLQDERIIQVSGGEIKLHHKHRNHGPKNVKPHKMKHN